MNNNSAFGEITEVLKGGVAGVKKVKKGAEKVGGKVAHGLVKRGNGEPEEDFAMPPTDVPDETFDWADIFSIVDENGSGYATSVEITSFFEAAMKVAEGAEHNKAIANLKNQFESKYKDSTISRDAFIQECESMKSEQEKEKVQLVLEMICEERAGFDMIKVFKSFLLLLFYPASLFRDMYRSLRYGGSAFAKTAVKSLFSLAIWLYIPAVLVIFGIFYPQLVDHNISTFEVICGPLLFSIVQISSVLLGSISVNSFAVEHANAVAKNNFKEANLDGVLKDISRYNPNRLMGTLWCFGLALVVSLSPRYVRNEMKGPLFAPIENFIEVSSILINLMSIVTVLVLLRDVIGVMKTCLHALKKCTKFCSLNDHEGFAMKSIESFQLWLDMRSYAKNIAINPQLSVKMFVMVGPLVVFVVAVGVIIFYRIIISSANVTVFAVFGIAVVMVIACFLFVVLFLGAAINSELQKHKGALSKVRLALVRQKVSIDQERNATEERLKTAKQNNNPFAADGEFDAIPLTQSSSGVFEEPDQRSPTPPPAPPGVPECTTPKVSQQQQHQQPESDRLDQQSERSLTPPPESSPLLGHPPPKLPPLAPVAAASAPKPRPVAPPLLPRAPSPAFAGGPPSAHPSARSVRSARSQREDTPSAEIFKAVYEDSEDDTEEEYDELLYISDLDDFLVQVMQFISYADVPLKILGLPITFALLNSVVTVIVPVVGSSIGKFAEAKQEAPSSEQF